MKIGIHIFKNKVDVYVIAGLDHIQQLDDIIMGGKFLCVERKSADE